MPFFDHPIGQAVGYRAGFPVLGTTANIPSVVEKQRIGLILYAISKISRAERKRIINLCQRTSARLIAIPDLMEVLRNPINKSIDEG